MFILLPQQKKENHKLINTSLEMKNSIKQKENMRKRGEKKIKMD